MNITEIVQTGLSVVGAASAVAAVVPHPTAVTGGLAVLRAVLDVVALNLGNAHNAKSPARKPKKSEKRRGG